jgi:hypothetical protein
VIAQNLGYGDDREAEVLRNIFHADRHTVEYIVLTSTRFIEMSRSCKSDTLGKRLYRFSQQKLSQG